MRNFLAVVNSSEPSVDKKESKEVRNNLKKFYNASNVELQSSFEQTPNYNANPSEVLDSVPEAAKKVKEPSQIPTPEHKEENFNALKALDQQQPQETSQVV